MKRYRFLHAAAKELDSATAWYEERSAVAPHFVDLVERAIKRIRKRPLMYPAWPGLSAVRRCILRRFPFVIVYAMLEDEIVVIAVAHSRKRPGYWVRRLRSLRDEQ